MVIRGHPHLGGALIVRQGKSRGALLVESKPNVGLQDHTLVEKIWPLTEEANPLTHGREGISREDVLIVEADMPFKRTEKGTIREERTEEVYADEMKVFYDGLKTLEIG